MEIELLTTKKKLQKSHIEQMQQLHTIEQFNNSTVLCWVMLKGVKCGILEYYPQPNLKAYLKLPLNWQYKVGDKYVWRKAEDRGSYTKQFDTPELAEQWFDLFLKDKTQFANLEQTFL